MNLAQECAWWLIVLIQIAKYALPTLLPNAKFVKRATTITYFVVILAIKTVIRARRIRNAHLVMMALTLTLRIVYASLVPLQL